MALPDHLPICGRARYVGLTHSDLRGEYKVVSVEVTTSSRALAGGAFRDRLGVLASRSIYFNRAIRIYDTGCQGAACGATNNCSDGGCD